MKKYFILSFLFIISFACSISRAETQQYEILHTPEQEEARQRELVKKRYLEERGPLSLYPFGDFDKKNQNFYGIAPLVTYSPRDFYGLGAGIFSIVKGDFYGLEMSGIGITKGDFYGLKMSGIGIADGDFSGIQIGGVCGAGDYPRGIGIGDAWEFGKATAIFSYADFTGIQIGVFFSSTFGDFTGIQIGPMCETYGDFRGIQMSFYGNITKGDFSGIQIGLINGVEGRLHGVQIGLLNFCKQGFMPLINMRF